jgi:asparagine synthase (glutamine-hydrolysing)
MCGISGIINKSGQPVSNALIENITNLVFHRGPDGSDYFHHSNISLGHRRLSIIDLSEDGKQPMHYLNRYTITYNGEIFNYIELRNELKTYGYSFNTASDTEVILAAYDKWKDDCPNKLNGMWAFAIFDKEKKILFCSRDRYGIKPFYFINSTEYFSFGSEIKQLLPFISKRKVNNKILADYLLNDLLEHSNETFFEEIFKLPTANNLIYNLNDSTYIINQYYTIKHINEYSKLNLKDACELYKEKFSESVKLRLRSDVKVGTCLSGGLDSSSVASVASKLFHENSSEKFMAVTAKSQESETDETYFAQLVAKNAMLDYNELFPNETQFSQTLDKVISLQEEPFISPSVFMQYFVFEKAKQLGCIVMLDGQGGDETLLGYERHYVSHFLNSSPALLLKELYLASAHSKLSLAKLFSYYLYFSLDFPKKLRPEKLFPYVKKPLFESAAQKLLKPLFSCKK